MDVVYERCCGIDVHKRGLVACVVTPGPDGQPRKVRRSFGTLTDELLTLGDWLTAEGVTHVALESTGVYWKPLWNLLEDRFTLLLVNAQHVKAVPGRKTDVKDCEWLADLLRHGLLKPSFVPPRPQRELRELTRYRTSLVRERAAEANRIQKTLEGANLKLGDVASDVLGVSGRHILEALIAGTDDPALLADLAQGKLRDKRAVLERALTGRIGAHQRFLLGEQLAHLHSLEGSIERVSAEIEERLRPFAEAVARLDEMPGVGQRTAEILLAEVGPDLQAFPSARHLASWAGVCPGQHESAGKRRTGKTRKGNQWLRTALVEAAKAAVKKKGSYLAAQYARLAARRGAARATLAVAHSLLVTAYYLLTRGTRYVDLGADHLDQRNRDQLQRRLVRRLEGLGLRVTLEPLPAGA